MDDARRHQTTLTGSAWGPQNVTESGNVGACRDGRKGQGHMKLNDRVIGGLRLAEGQRDKMVFDSSCPGLGVRITAKSKTFLCQWTDPVTKRKQREPIGVWGNLTLDQAREACRARLGRVAQGENPRTERLRRRAEAEREKAESALTFGMLVDEWASLHLAHRRPRYAAEAVRAIRYSLKDLLAKPAVRITRADAVNALDRITRSGKVTTAVRVRSYARSAFNWGCKRGKVPTNPFADLPVSADMTERDRVLDDGELAELWAAVEQEAYPFGGFFALLTLTLQRHSEVAGMRWAELADDYSVWTLPPQRMKNAKPNSVHLPQAAREILRALPRFAGSPFVFTTTGRTPISGMSKAKARLDARIIKARADAAAKAGKEPAPLIPWKLHDLRRSGVSTLARLGVDSIVADMILAHKPAKLRGVAGVYQKYEFGTERARALDAWAEHVTGSGTGGNVVPLRKAG